MSLAPHVATLGRGPGRSRSLTFEEAQDAMAIMLSGKAAPEAVGALLMLLRMKGEEPQEIAGLASAAATHTHAPKADLDWPSYAAGRTRGAPMFLLAAKVVAEAGHRVLLHGWNGPDPTIRNGLAIAGIEQATSIAHAETLLDQHRITYLPLETLSPELFALLSLRPVLGLRSCINTVCRMFNPGGAAAAVQGVFHPTYRGLQQLAAQQLGLKDLTVIKGGGGEFERHPGKEAEAFGLRGGALWTDTAPALCTDRRRLADIGITTEHLSDIAQGKADNAFVTHCVLATATLALQTLGRADASLIAAHHWHGRNGKRAA